MARREKTRLWRLVRTLLIVFIVFVVMSVYPFKRGSSRMDVSSGIVEFTNHRWWGLTTKVTTRMTWVGEHATPMEDAPVWQDLGRSWGGILTGRGGVTQSPFAIIRNRDEQALMACDRYGVIPTELVTPVANAVRAQWLRIVRGEADPAWVQGETIASQLRYWSFEDRVLTADVLLQLEQGVPWDQVLSPE